MPSAIVPMDTTVIKENQVEVRYAFNYCTLNYTFSYADAEEFQREYDWMALNGVNCVLDLAGQEAVWIMFLMNFGYTYDEAKDWIAGVGSGSGSGFGVGVGSAGSHPVITARLKAMDIIIKIRFITSVV